MEAQNCYPNIHKIKDTVHANEAGLMEHVLFLLFI